ncbi:hypothetical protein FH5_03358 [Priestia endophytica]|nr:hypothetical protein FH5_03358 [Priestia endophytica]
MIKDKEERKRFSTLENALHVLELFSVEEPELGISEIANQLGIANSTAYRLVTSLRSEGFITKDAHTNLYRLGTSILALGNVIIKQSKVYNISQSILKSLVQQTNETAHIAVLREFEAMYLNKIVCSHPVRLLSYIGKCNPVHCTSTGQVLLAHQSKPFIEELFQKKLQRYTSKTIIDPASLLDRLQKIKKQGYALSVEELHKGVSSISAPIYNLKGNVIASVTIAGPVQRMNNNMTSNLIKSVIQSANEISQLLHYR